MAGRGRAREQRVTLLYVDFVEIGKNLSGEEFKALWYAAAEYQVHGTEYCGDNRTVALLFPVIKLQSDRYANACRQNAANASGRTTEVHEITRNSAEVNESTPPYPYPIPNPYPNPNPSSNEEEYRAASAHVCPKENSSEQDGYSRAVRVTGQWPVSKHKPIIRILGSGKPVRARQNVPSAGTRVRDGPACPLLAAKKPPRSGWGTGQLLKRGHSGNQKDISQTR